MKDICIYLYLGGLARIFRTVFTAPVATAAADDINRAVENESRSLMNSFSMEGG